MRVMPFPRVDSVGALPVLYGKLPNRPDFLRIQAQHPVVQEIDVLVQQALERRALHGGWESAYDAAPAVDLYYLSRDRVHCFLGGLLPSRDQSGRRYPLLGGLVLPADEVLIQQGALPIAYEVFLEGLREQMANAVDNSVEALACRQYLESHAQSPGADAADLALAGNVVRRFMELQAAARLNALLDGGLQQALLNVAFYQAYLRRFDNQATNPVIVLPLSGEAGEHPLLASAWLSLLSSLWFDRSTRWPASAQRVDGLGLVVSVGRLSERFLSPALGGEVDVMMRLDLGTPHEAWRSHRLYPEVAYALGRLLADPACTLAALHDYLKDIGRQLQPVL